MQVARTPLRQQGVALITALLVVALAAIAAAAMLTSANIAVHRTQNLQDSENAWWYADGVESWVKSILERDIDDNKFDSLKDAWAKPVDYLPIDQGFVRGAVVDLQGRFNLNNLTIGGATPADKAQFEKHQEIFLRLLNNIEGVDELQARAVVSAIRDWGDKDSETTGFDGAEDSDYLSVQPPYRVPNRPMESVSELLAIKGMNKKLYQQLAQYVTVLPTVNTPINVNTAPEAVLRALVKQPSADFEGFVRDRIEKPAETIAELTTKGTFGAADASPELLTTVSQFFMLRAEVTVGSGRVVLHSTYFRPTGGRPAVIARSTNTP